MKAEDYTPELLLKILRRCANDKCDGCPVQEYDCEGKVLDAAEMIIRFEDSEDAESFDACHHGDMDEDCVRCKFQYGPPKCHRKLLKRCAWQLERNIRDYATG